MNKFLLRFLLFISPILLVIYPLDMFISKNLSKSKDLLSGEISEWSDIYSSNINVDIAIYGSSRAWVHIDPQILKDTLNKTAYNFGVDGHNFWLQYLRNIEYLKYNKKPDYILYSVDAFSLAKRKELYNNNQFLPFMLYNRAVFQYTSSYDGFSFGDYFLPMFRYYGKLDMCMKAIQEAFSSDTSTKHRANGYRGTNGLWREDVFEKDKSSMEGTEVVLDSLSIKLFESFLNESRMNKIQVIFVYTPEYIEGQRFFKNKNEIMSFMKAYAEEQNIIFLDYTTDTLCLNKKYFYNSMHLNKKGSELFSSKLASDMKKIIEN